MHVLWEELTGGWHDLEPLVRLIVRLLAAAVLGGVLGLERRYEHKSAGMRTHMLQHLCHQAPFIVRLLRLVTLRAPWLIHQFTRPSFAHLEGFFQVLDCRPLP